MLKNAIQSADYHPNSHESKQEPKTIVGQLSAALVRLALKEDRHD